MPNNVLSMVHNKAPFFFFFFFFFAGQLATQRQQEYILYS